MALIYGCFRLFVANDGSGDLALRMPPEDVARPRGGFREVEATEDLANCGLISVYRFADERSARAFVLGIEATGRDDMRTVVERGAPYAEEALVLVEWSEDDPLADPASLEGAVTFIDVASPDEAPAPAP